MQTEEKTYPVYSSQTKDNGLMGYYSEYLYEDAITWTTDGANAGTVNFRSGKFYCTNVCGVLLSDKVKANKMIAEALNKVAKGYVSYVGNPKLMNNVMADIPIMIATQEEEREKIGEYFSKLDTLITLHQRKCINNTIKHINDWEQRKLCEVCQVTMGQSPDGSTYSETPSDYILVQGNADLKDGWVFPRIWTTQKTKTAEAGDLIMSVRAPAGAMGKTSYNIVLGRGVAGIKGNEFIYQSLIKMDSDGYWKKLAAGSTFESINSNVVNGAELVVPQDIAEQDRIGEYFASLDKLITLHQR